MSQDDYIHVDDCVEVACENGWLTPKDIAGYIRWMSKDNKNLEERKEFFKKLKKLLRKEGFELTKSNKIINPSLRGD